jgi:hypothetical protein
MLRRISLALLAILLCSPSSVQAQRIPTGYVSLFGDYIPNRSDTVELRSRLFAEQTFEPSEAVRLTLSGFAEALVARRPVPTVDGTVRSGSVTDGILKAHDANVEILGRKADVLAGYARVVWGKLDEIQPTDVINPLDVSRFFFEGRSEARLPVLMIRGRLHPNEHISVEGIYVPDFRRGRFDQLDEDTSPFNITTAAGVDAVTCLALGCPAVLPPIVDRQPALTWRNADDRARGLERLRVSRLRTVRTLSTVDGGSASGHYNPIGSCAAAVSALDDARGRLRSGARCVRFPGRDCCVRRRQLSVARSANRIGELNRWWRRIRPEGRRLHDQRHRPLSFRVVR